MAPSTTLLTSSTRHRAAGVLATAALASLLTITPAFAESDATGSSRTDGSQLQNSSGATTPEKRIYQSDIEREKAKQLQNKKAEDLRNRKAATMGQRGSTSVNPAKPGPAAITVDDNAVEYLQIGLGALAGMAALGAVAAATRRRTHAHPA